MHIDNLDEIITDIVRIEFQRYHKAFEDIKKDIEKYSELKNVIEGVEKDLKTKENYPIRLKALELAMCNTINIDNHLYLAEEYFQFLVKGSDTVEKNEIKVEENE